MEQLITFTGSWWWLLLLAALLLGLYFLLEFSWRLVQALNLRPGIREFLHRWLWRIRIGYEPVALAILVVVFLLINPLVHSIAAVTVVAIAFPHFRNYLSGRLLKLENSLRIGEEISCGDIRGEVTRMGRLGVKVREADGLHHMGYHFLVQKGYVLVAGSETGEFFNLFLRPEDTESSKDTENDVINLFANAPYVDWSFRPEVLPTEEDQTEWRVKVQLRDAQHFSELIRLLGESGYVCNSSPKPRS